MRQRVISTVVGLGILAVVLFFHNTIVLNIAIAIVSIIATYELMRATRTLPYIGFALVGLGFSASLPFMKNADFGFYVKIGVVVLSVLFVVATLNYSQRIQFSRVTTALFSMLYPSVFFSTAVYMRDVYGSSIGFFLLALALGSAWFADTGAFCFGYLMGKHQLAPKISPKKTVEGAIGGVITATALNLLMAFVYSKVLNTGVVVIEINYLAVGILSPVFASIGILGDLLASVIKRQHEIKDYGNIMPGHGGVMDRFDSAVLTLPAVYMAMSIYKFVV